MNSAVIAAIRTAVFSRLNMRWPCVDAGSTPRDRCGAAAGVQSPGSGSRASNRRPGGAGRAGTPRAASASAARALQLDQLQRALAAGHRERAAVDGEHLARARRVRRRRLRRASSLTRLAVERSVRARETDRRRAAGARSSRRRLAPVDRRFGLLDLVRVGHAVVRLRRARQRAAAASRPAPRRSARRRARPAGRAASRRCRRRAIVRRLDQQHGAGVEAGVHLHDA